MVAKRPFLARCGYIWLILGNLGKVSYLSLGKNGLIRSSRYAILNMTQCVIARKYDSYDPN